MVQERANIFEQAADTDLSVFRPKAQGEASRPSADDLKSLDSGKFRSREAQAVVPEPPAAAAGQGKRKPFTYRTGRTETLSVKTTPAAVSEFYAIAEENGFKAGETFERAIAALRRELQGPG